MINSNEENQTLEEDFNEKLIELRNTFANTVALNNTLESKASSFIGFSALIISVILFTLNSILSQPSNGPITNFWIQITFYILIVILIIIIGWGLVDLWKVIRLRVYNYPFLSCFLWKHFSSYPMPSASKIKESFKSEL